MQTPREVRGSRAMYDRGRGYSLVPAAEVEELCETG